MPTIRLWAETFDEVAPGAIEGIYLVGSAALDDWHPHSSDIDIVAITAEPADEEMAGALLTAHAVFTERCAGGPSVDGPFVAWGDLVVSPQASARPWTLDGRFYHDAECFELNPVTWYTLAHHGVRLRGPEPAELGIPVDDADRVRFVIDNSISYWDEVHKDFVGALGELGPDGTLPSSVPIWCLLGACRMLYTATTGGVTSKSQAGLWAAEEIGDDSGVLKEVVRLRAEPDQPVARALLSDAAQLMGYVIRLIKATDDRVRAIDPADFRPEFMSASIRSVAATSTPSPEGVSWPPPTQPAQSPPAGPDRYVQGE